MDGIRVQCCKKQYCIGTWNVRSMNWGKLEVVKQEMARVNINILGISKLKWTRMGEFYSDDHYIYYCGQQSLRKNGVALIVSKRVRNAVLGCNFTNDRMISVHFQGKPFNITVIQVYAPTSNAEEDLQDILEPTPKKRCPFHYRGLECRSRKLRDTWSNRQVWPWSTKWSRAEANRVLPRECTAQSKHPLPIAQEKTTHGHHQMVNTEIRLIIFFAAKDGEALYSQQKQDWELTVAQIIVKFRLKLKKVGKTTRLFQVWPKSNPLQLYSESEK